MAYSATYGLWDSRHTAHSHQQRPTNDCMIGDIFTNTVSSPMQKVNCLSELSPELHETTKGTKEQIIEICPCWTRFNRSPNAAKKDTNHFGINNLPRVTQAPQPSARIHPSPLRRRRRWARCCRRLPAQSSSHFPNHPIYPPRLKPIPDSCRPCHFLLLIACPEPHRRVTVVFPPAIKKWTRTF